VLKGGDDESCIFDGSGGCALGGAVMEGGDETRDCCVFGTGGGCVGDP